MKDLTDKQNSVFEFIAKAIREKGFPPTIREIGEQFGISAKGAYDHLKAIEKKGFLRTSKNQSRAIEILKLSDDDKSSTADITKIPLLGRIAAGSPILAEENIEEYIPVGEELSHKSGLFGLRVQGDSMIEAGIHSKDIAIIQKQEVAKDGDIVAALLDGDSATLKVYYKEKDKVRLEPRNANLKPIFSEQIQILGKLVGLIRYY